MTLSRRDRAALVLAYECVRRDDEDFTECLCPLGCGGPVASAIHDEYLDHYADAEEHDHGDRVVPRNALALRVLRARLALLLRVLLRADAVTCTADEYDVLFHEPAADEEPTTWQPYTTRIGFTAWRRPTRIRPLWETAPAREGS